MGLQATASRLLKTYGDAVSLSYSIGGVINHATGEVTTPATNVTINGHGYPGRYMANEIDGTNIQSGDIRLTLERISARPMPGWLCTVDGSAYRVMDVRPVRSQADDVIYILQLRRN